MPYFTLQNLCWNVVACAYLTIGLHVPQIYMSPHFLCINHKNLSWNILYPIFPNRGVLGYGSKHRMVKTLEDQNTHKSNHRSPDATVTETEMSSFWRNFHHWLHWKLSFWQLSVQPVMKISSKWRHFRFSGKQKRVTFLRWQILTWV